MLDDLEADHDRERAVQAREIVVTRAEMERGTRKALARQLDTLCCRVDADDLVAASRQHVGGGAVARADLEDAPVGDRMLVEDAQKHRPDVAIGPTRRCARIFRLGNCMAVALIRYSP